MADLKWKATPKAKVFEAWSAVADGRVSIASECQATVQSSDKAKTYTVVWTPDRQSFGANDNASYWVGYMGYPILATAIQLELVSVRQDIVREFRNINWNYLNKVYKRRYDDVVEYVILQIEREGRGKSEIIRQHADEVFDQLQKLKLGRILPPGDPPKRPKT